MECIVSDFGFPCGSAGKESACNVGDLGSIPGSGRSPGEGKDYPLQYSGLENSMDCMGSQRVGQDWATFTSGEGNGNPLQYSCLENSMIRGTRHATVHGLARVQHDLVTKPPEDSKRFIPSFWKPKFKKPFALFMYMKTNSCQKKQIAKYRGWKMWIITGIKINI